MFSDVTAACDSPRRPAGSYAADPAIAGAGLSAEEFARTPLAWMLVALAAAMILDSIGRRETIIVHIPMRKRGGRKLVVAPDGAPWPRVDNAMVKALAAASRHVQAFQRSCSLNGQSNWAGSSALPSASAQCEMNAVHIFIERRFPLLYRNTVHYPTVDHRAGRESVHTKGQQKPLEVDHCPGK